MSLFPMYQIPAPSQGEALPLYQDVAMDYTTGKPMWRNGDPVWVTGLEAVKSWAWRAVATQRFRWISFSWDYGCELLSLIGYAYQSSTKLSEARRYVKDCLLASPYITNVEVTNETFAGDTLHMDVSFTSIYGGGDFSV